MKKVRISGIAGIALLAIIIFLVFGIFIGKLDLRAIKKAPATSENIQIEKLGPDYELGSNWHNQVVFKHPSKALEKMKTDFVKSINEIKKEYHTADFSESKKTISDYRSYGYQLKTKNQQLIKEALLLSDMLDIYGHSYREGIWSNDILN